MILRFGVLQFGGGIKKIYKTNVTQCDWFNIEGNLSMGNLYNLVKKDSYELSVRMWIYPRVKLYSTTTLLSSKVKIINDALALKLAGHVI